MPAERAEALERTVLWEQDVQHVENDIPINI